MSLAWILSALLLLLSTIEILCYCIAPPVQLSRCERSVPSAGGFHLIPAAIYSNGVHHFIRPLTLAPSDVNRRQTRQHQSSVVQQVTINQNTGAFGGGRPSSFGFGGGHDVRPPFRGPPHHHHGFPHDFGHSSKSFGRPPPHSFDGFRRRSFEKTECAESSKESNVPLPRCPSSYVFSCQPTVTSVPCGQNKPCS